MVNASTTPPPPAAAPESSLQSEWRDLHSAVRSDISDTDQWRKDQDHWRQVRRKEDKPKKEAYPGASAVVEGVVDENVAERTSQEVAILWQTRNLAQFVPMDAASAQAAPRAQAAFDNLLRVKLNIRQRISSILNYKNERGLGLAKQSFTESDGGSGLLPDIEAVDPVDVVVPVSCKVRDFQSCDRIAHILKYGRREFEQLAEKRGWTNWREVWERSHSEDNLAAMRSDGAIGSVPSNDSRDDTIVLWEIYHWREDAGQWRRHVTVMSESDPDNVLESRPWEWPRIVSSSVVEATDPSTGLPSPSIVVNERPDPEDRPWPFVVFRFEEISDYYHESRGISELTEQYQREVSNFKNARNSAIDRMCKPYISARNPEAVRNFKFRPGECIPDNAQIVYPGAGVENLFSLPSDSARALAARRAGAGLGSLSSATPGNRNTKTATEVSTQYSLALASSQNGIESAAEPLARLFGMMWTWACKHGTTLSTAISAEENSALLSGRYSILCGASGRMGNPEYVMGLLQSAQPWIQPMAQFIRWDQFSRMFFDLLSPQLSDQIVVQSGQGSGVEQRLAQLGQSVQMLSQAVQQLSAPQGLPPQPPSP